MSRTARLLLLAVTLAAVAFVALSCGGDDELILATTTSTQDSGLLDVLIPRFEEQYGYKVKTIAVGSGQAIRMGEEGEADVLLAHSPDAEEEFMAAGHGEERRAVMHNDFVLLGPPDDPAGVGKATSAAEAFAAIAGRGALFLSRGDESGTHTKELSLWKAAGVEPDGTWYQETGQGMGATLNVANEKRGYTLSDRGTYLAQHERLDLVVLFEGDPALYNVYHVIVVSHAKHPGVNVRGARAFADFITAPETQSLIRNFGVDRYGQSLFMPDALVGGLGATASPAPAP